LIVLWTGADVARPNISARNQNGHTRTDRSESVAFLSVVRPPSRKSWRAAPPLTDIIWRTRGRRYVARCAVLRKAVVLYGEREYVAA